MDALPHILACYVPYLCAALASMAAYLLTERSSMRRLLASFLAGTLGAVSLAAIANLFSVHAPVVLGNCSPLTLGACILGSITAVGLIHSATPAPAKNCGSHG